MHGRLFRKLIVVASLCAAMAMPAFAEEPAAPAPAAEEQPAQAPAQAPAAPVAKQAKHEGPSLVLEDVVITGTREGELKSETPLSIDALKRDEIHDARPTHPSEVMGKIPGVHITQAGGEGHTTAIRHPITTSPVYLYLEDGIPTRSTGFFNHNALYEVNIPQSGGVEVIKGPGTALYGSDAIGGTVNVLTRPAPDSPELETNIEYGSFGWLRALVSGGASGESNGARLDANITQSGGWRNSSNYDKKAATLRWDKRYDSGAKLKTVAAWADIYQNHTSNLSRSDYENNPTINNMPITYRKVSALRVSAAYDRETEDTLFSVTPYIRANSMNIIPNWSLTYDPQLYTSKNDSFGVMAKYRMDFEPMRTRLILGADGDYSPGSFYENTITTAKTGSAYTSYTVGAVAYDYKVAFQGISPYAHLEFSPTDKLRMNLGLRYDNIGYSYQNNLSTVTTGSKRRPGDTTVNFTHVSPKVGLTYAFTEELNTYISWRHAFRAPSEGQLFRQGQAVNTVDLKPVKVDSYDIGVRGGGAETFSYEVSGYYMKKTDDVVSYTNTADGTRETLNAGETLHRGVEVGVGAPLASSLRLNIAYSNAKHTYEKWSPKTGIDYSGKEQTSAPSEIANADLAYTPNFLGGGKFQLDWERLGSYWQDDDNTNKYGGHDLFHFKVSYKHSSGLEIYGRIKNLTDARFASTSSYTVARGEELSPGNPRAFYVGVDYAFK